MAAPPKILRASFKEGVYLNGTVKQGIGLTPKNGEPQPISVGGITIVERIEPSPVGLLVEMNPPAGLAEGQKSRCFLVPWQHVAVVEIANPWEAPPPVVLTTEAKDVALRQIAESEEKLRTVLAQKAFGEAGPVDDLLGKTEAELEAATAPPPPAAPPAKPAPQKSRQG